MVKFPKIVVDIYLLNLEEINFINSLNLHSIFVKYFLVLLVRIDFFILQEKMELFDENNNITLSKN